MNHWQVEWEVVKKDGTTQAAVRVVESDHILTAYDKVRQELEGIRFDSTVENVRITSISAS